MSSIVNTNIRNHHQATDANVDTIGNTMHVDIAYNDNDDDDDDALSTDSRPTSLREFFQGFWAEFKSRAEGLVQYGVLQLRRNFCYHGLVDIFQLVSVTIHGPMEGNAQSKNMFVIMS